MKLSTHVAYNGNCEEAFNFYKSIFGGEFDTVQRNKDIPAEAASPVKGGEEDKILHISLPIGKHSMLMGCDMPAAFGEATRSNSFNISISTDSEADTERIYNSLLAGGKVNMPLDKTFWGAYFGMVVDKYGVQWMISYDYGH
jgi:PhnB protein